jgi:hypothetical protein
MQILTELVLGETGYRLQVDDGVVHVFRKDVLNQPGNFLNIRIKKFDVQGSTAPEAARKLWMLLNQRVFRPPTAAGSHGGVGFSLGERTDEPTFNLHLRGATVRRILDSIATLSKDKIWLVTFAPGRSLMVSGFRRTVSPTKAVQTPDAGQPGWESLRWGERPY